MSYDYKRVAPRDFFNEGKLLSGIGAMAVKLEKTFAYPEPYMNCLDEAELGFTIRQDQSSGDIWVANWALCIPHRKRRHVYLWHSLNSRETYTLFIKDLNDEEIPVFDSTGELSMEFVNHINYYLSIR